MSVSVCVKFGWWCRSAPSSAIGLTICCSTGEELIWLAMIDFCCDTPSNYLLLPLCRFAMLHHGYIFGDMCLANYQKCWPRRHALGCICTAPELTQVEPMEFKFVPMKVNKQWYLIKYAALALKCSSVHKVHSLFLWSLHSCWIVPLTHLFFPSSVVSLLLLSASLHLYQTRPHFSCCFSFFLLCGCYRLMFFPITSRGTLYTWRARWDCLSLLLSASVSSCY